MTNKRKLSSPLMAWNEEEVSARLSSSSHGRRARAAEGEEQNACFELLEIPIISPVPLPLLFLRVLIRSARFPLVLFSARNVSGIRIFRGNFASTSRR